MKIALRTIAAIALTTLAVGCDSAGQGRRASSNAPTQLFLAGDNELWVIDTDTGKVRHRKVIELSPGDPPYRILRRGNQLVTWAGATYVRNLNFAKPAVPLAEDAGFFIPSAREDRVWLGIFKPMSNALVAAMREVTVTGKVTVPDARPPAGHWPDGAVTDGLLFELRGGREAVWDPVSNKILRRLPIGAPGPTYGNLIVSCGPDCRTLRLTDAHTGDSKAVGVPHGFASFGAWSGAFSPDGSLYAVPVTSDQSFRHPELGLDLALVDVSRGAARVVDGAHVHVGYTLVAWSSSGDTVFFTGGERFKKRTVLSYRVGEARARVLYQGLGDFYGIAAS